MSDVWDEGRVQRWLDQADGLDRQMAPITAALLRAAALQSGERVLDVGCGHGPTTRAAAEAVGAGGAVTGLDISEPMLRAAAELPAADGAAHIDWVAADAVAWDPAGSGHSGYDAVISRFGVMFFTDPVEAFANLLAATSAGGRLAVVTWATRHRSELFELPLSVTVPILRAHGVSFEVPPVDVAAFSLGTPERLAEVLGAAGWTHVATEEHEGTLAVHGGVGPEAAAKAGLDLGPTRVVMAGQPEPLRAEVAAAIAEAYVDRTDAAGHVRLGATFLVTTARA